MSERNGEILLRFLHSLGAESLTRPSHLFLVGDIFDLWIGSHPFFIRRFAPLVEAIRRLVDAGVSVHYFEGNHDLYLGEFWQGEAGVQVHSGPEHFELCGRKVRIEHGDQINPDDKGYLFFRALLRSAPVVALARGLPSSVVTAIGERASALSRDYTSSAKGLPAERLIEIVRRHAETAYMEQAFDLIITGHVHVIDDHVFQAGERAVRSVNLGSWFDRPRTFLLTDEDAAGGGRFVDL